MNQGDVYLVQPDPTNGHEQRGSRPVVIVSRTAFNTAIKLPVVCPITTGGAFARRIGFAVPVTGVKTQGLVRCDQPRVLDLAARNAKKVGRLPAEVIEEVLAKLIPIFV
jgi:mRNA interferase ChpB